VKHFGPPKSYQEGFCKDT